MRKKKLFLLMIICGAILFFSRCLRFKNGYDPRGEAYAGSSACVNCHQAIYTSYLHTAHYRSASPALPATIAGPFSKDSNSFILNDTVKMVMEKRGNTAYQVLYVNGKEVKALRFDIVFGDVKGQSYLYWKDDLVFELPVSYFTGLHSWTTSPGAGYAAGRMDLDRPIGRRCFECHTSYVGQSPSQARAMQNENALDRSSLIYNIDCERCHGPAAAHVQFHTENPTEKEGRYIASFKTMTRAQKISTCAVCHSGNRNVMLKSTFAFKPGDTLSQFMAADNMSPAQPDVHGNQVQLLAESKCFRMSDMNCSTCHNTHVNDRGNHAMYANTCTTCHSVADHNFCKMADRVSTAFLQNNCTRCHMPEQPSSAIVVQTTKNRTNIPCFIVNHRIAVYPKESEEILKKQ